MSLSEKIQHEESLINSRLTWMLTFQGFLFASIALSKEEVSQNLLFHVLPILGALIAGITFLGVIAAYISIGQARNNASTEENFGGKGLAKILGRINQIGLPTIIFCAWVYIYIYLV